MIVCLDPGHGGKDPGAVALDMYGHVFERDIALAVALKARAILEEDSSVTEVVMTRDRDITKEPKDRVAVSNLANADLFISIHVNSHHDSIAHGVEVLHFSSSKYGKRLSESMLSEVAKQWPDRTIRGAKERDDLIVLRETKAVAVLVEMEFMSNADGFRFLQCESVRSDYAALIAELPRKLASYHQ